MVLFLGTSQKIPKNDRRVNPLSPQFLLLDSSQSAVGFRKLVVCGNPTTSRSDRWSRGRRSDPIWLGTEKNLAMDKSHTQVLSYPLVMTNITIERSTIFNGKLHYKWSFSIAMLNYQRVYIWLVVWNMNFMTFHILGIIIPTDSYFSEGLTPPTRYIVIAIVTHYIIVTIK